MKLHRNPLGRLVLQTDDGQVFEPVTAVRAYPLSDPTRFVSLVGADGQELHWIDALDRLAPDTRALVEAELRQREFMPEIQRLVSVSSFATPSTWTMETHRGPTQLVLKGEEDIRRLGHGVLLIADTHGVQFMIRDLAQLDRHSRRLLDRFL